MTGTCASNPDHIPIIHAEQMFAIPKFQVVAYKRHVIFYQQKSVQSPFCLYRPASSFVFFPETLPLDLLKLSSPMISTIMGRRQESMYTA